MPLLQGIPDILDNWLGLMETDRYGTRLRYHSQIAAANLSRNVAIRPVDGQAPVAEAMAILQENLFQHRRSRAWVDNWRWKKSLCLPRKNDPTRRPLPDGMDSGNSDPARTLCLLAASLLGDNWVDQIPICDGLVGQSECSRRIDMAHRRHRTHYELFDLNFDRADPGSGLDTPLSAAMELLQCGLIYILSRAIGFLDIRLHLDHHILHAGSIDLVVLAPEEWFKFGDHQTEPYDFGWLENSINSGLQDYLRDQEFKMRFRFQVLDNQFSSNLKGMMTEVALFRAGALTLRDDLYGHDHPE